MRIIDCYADMLTSYEGNAFSFEKWRVYIDTALPGIASLIVSDTKQSLASGGVSWESDILPVLNAVAQNTALRERAHDSFCSVTKHLSQRVQERFGRNLDVDVILYLGLCNGAGWVTEHQGRRVILLGIEKIMELHWCSPDDLRGLIYHELGHAYQAQYGVLKRIFDRSADMFLGQLFTEGIAMYFEQELVGDPDYYHQDRNGWKGWCAAHLAQIKADFGRDLQTMTYATQRYFGDWVEYDGHGDVGYYLGCCFVRFILRAEKFDALIGFDIDRVWVCFQQFMGQAFPDAQGVQSAH
ncbi:MAG: hypothetical protein ACI4WX_14760 [Aristaeellaceae bacterium]